MQRWQHSWRTSLREIINLNYYKFSQKWNVTPPKAVSPSHRPDVFRESDIRGIFEIGSNYSKSELVLPEYVRLEYAYKWCPARDKMQKTGLSNASGRTH